MNKDAFTLELNKINIQITEEEQKKFTIYKDLLKEYNEKFNLTSIIDDDKIYLKHFYDSLYLLTFKEIKAANSILDIGTGAGFPGMALAIMLPNTQITLVEANAKKCAFLKTVSETLDLKNVLVKNERAEEFSKKNREKFDIVTSRAVANLLVLSELEIPALKINGYFLPLKSHFEEELSISKEKIKNMGCILEDTINYYLPIENSQRTILKIKKRQKTQEMYPRDYSKIIKDLKKITK